MTIDTSRRAYSAAALVLATAFALGANAQNAAGDAAAAAKRPADDALRPLPGKRRQAPELTRLQTVRLETTAGDVVIEVYPEAAPNAAARFVELVESGFYDDTPISRVVPDFVAQFGVNWREPHRAWRERLFDDDPSLFALERGTLAFAKGGPNTNSTQVFINLKQNNELAEPRYNFTVFGKVVSGMDVVNKIAKVPTGPGAVAPRDVPRQPVVIESMSVVGGK